MNINRHNYEEYFILYMDNELGSEDRRQVEVFVQQNPDLKEELELLLQSKFTPESHIVFENKGELLHTAEGSSINISNYEEWLMLYFDNELPDAERMAVENFIASHSPAKKEFEAFRKAKLQPEENIVFPGKELLYRKTERAPLISMQWWKIAAAAILILGIGIGIVFISNNRKDSSSGPIVSKEIKGTDNTTNQSAVQKNQVAENNASLNTSENKNAVLNKTEQQQSNTSIAQQPKNNILVAQQTIRTKLKEPLKTDAPLIADNTTTNNLPSSINNPNANIKASSVPDVTIENVKTNLTAYQPEKSTVTNSTDEAYKNKMATENAGEKTDANYASLEEGSNKKSRGFFRKLTRFLEKNTKINPANDDDRVLIGAIAVKMK